MEYPDSLCLTTLLQGLNECLTCAAERLWQVQCYIYDCTSPWFAGRLLSDHLQSVRSLQSCLLVLVSLLAACVNWICIVWRSL